MSVEISQKLERDFGVSMNSDEVQQLSFAKLEEIAKNSKPSSKPAPDTETDSNPVKHDFFLELEELNPIQLNGSELDEKDPVWFVHPITGSCSVYRDIASCMDAPAFGLNYTSAAPLTSVEDLAEYYISLIGSRKRYALVGYSFGACVVLEMARQFRLSSREVTLLLVDGSHAFVSEIIKVRIRRRRLFIKYFFQGCALPLVKMIGQVLVACL